MNLIKKATQEEGDKRIVDYYENANKVYSNMCSGDLLCRFEIIATILNERGL